MYGDNTKNYYKRVLIMVHVSAHGSGSYARALQVPALAFGRKYRRQLIYCSSPGFFVRRMPLQSSVTFVNFSL